MLTTALFDAPRNGAAKARKRPPVGEHRSCQVDSGTAECLV